MLIWKVSKHVMENVFIRIKSLIVVNGVLICRIRCSSCDIWLNGNNNYGYVSLEWIGILKFLEVRWGRCVLQSSCWISLSCRILKVACVIWFMTGFIWWKWKKSASSLRWLLSCMSCVCNDGKEERAKSQTSESKPRDVYSGMCANGSSFITLETVIIIVIKLYNHCILIPCWCC